MQLQIEHQTIFSYDEAVCEAIGRDYSEAAPMRGLYQGGAKEKLAVRVRLRAADEPHKISIIS